MCCFSGPVKVVADTNIFARAGKAGRQFLVYSMRFSAASEVAMILPLPTPKNSPEDAVNFLNFDKYPSFFDEMRKGFPEPKSDSKTRQPQEGHSLGLKVVEVGSFIASFVPKQSDFARLDARFRLPAGTWDKLPQYKDWGFAVFQLKKGEMKVHPMAFDFPRRDPKLLFFPTVHIHDGKVHDKAKFDHMLFAQFNAGEMVPDWEESTRPAENFMTKLSDAHGAVTPGNHVYRKIMKGMLKNLDVVV